MSTGDAARLSTDDEEDEPPPHPPSIAQLIGQLIAHAEMYGQVVSV